MLKVDPRISSYDKKEDEQWENPKQVARRWGRVCRRYSIRDELESGVIEEGGLVGGNKARAQLDGRFTLERFWLAGSHHRSRGFWESVAARAFVVTVRTPSVSFFYLCRTAPPWAQQGSQTDLWQWWAAQGRRRLCLASDASNQICAQTVLIMLQMGLSVNMSRKALWIAQWRVIYLRENSTVY